MYLDEAQIIARNFDSWKESGEMLELNPDWINPVSVPNNIGHVLN